MVGILTIFYIGAFMEFIALFMLYFYEEELDEDNLRKRGALK